jgi:hypothetical protein
MTAVSLTHYIEHRDQLWHELAPDESPSPQDVRQLALRNQICTRLLEKLTAGETNCVLENFCEQRIAIELLHCRTCATFIELCQREIAGRACRGIVTIAPMAEGGHSLVASPTHHVEPIGGLW